jgi:hypothetical protein
MEFKSFEKIDTYRRVSMTITQKIHGSNAQISIMPNMLTSQTGEEQQDGWIVQAGSRNRFLYPEDDNYGFARFVKDNEIALIDFLGPGKHFGEWAGPGINSGEGLKEKTFVLFDVDRYDKTKALPPQTSLVPVLFRGKIDHEIVEATMTQLKTHGSVLVPGFMRAEGIVVSIGGKRYKHVFDSEETKWKQGSGGPKVPQADRQSIDYSYLCQPLRLEKVLSKDSRYMDQFPKSLPTIVKAYIDDLVDENQIEGDEHKIAAVRKGCTSTIFSFVKSICNELEPVCEL